MKKKIIILSSMFLFLVAIASGQVVDYAKLGMETRGVRVPKGLSEGDKAPEFTGYDQTGKQVTLKSLLQKGPVVIFFYRGNWGPTCNKQLHSMQDSVKLITDQGVSLVAITPESIESVEHTVYIHEITFTVIYDCMEKMMQDYDVMFNVTKEYQDLVYKDVMVNIAEQNGHTPAHLPVTATYIINKQGIITARHFNPDFHFRASVKWIVKNIGTAL
jgi:peroxiredoxin